MAGIQLRRIKWLRTPSAWEQTKAWREARKEMMARFQQSAADATSSFTSAWQNKITGTATLAAQAAIDRSNAEIKAAKEQAETINKVV
jgi:hypothetical protein